jgi:uncharacterized membrane protein YagU involved in acid resistance
VLSEKLFESTLVEFTSLLKPITIDELTDTFVALSSGIVELIIKLAEEVVLPPLNSSSESLLQAPEIRSVINNANSSL